MYIHVHIYIYIYIVKTLGPVWRTSRLSPRWGYPEMPCLRLALLKHCSELTNILDPVFYLPKSLD